MRLLVAVLLASTACVDTEGEVLSTLGGDGGVGAIDGAGARDAGTDGGLDPCAMEIACPPEALPGAVTVCGRLLDVETSAYVSDGQVEIQFLNPVNPDSPSLGETRPDACGRFIVENMFGLLPGFVIASVDDDSLLGGDYERVVTLIPVAFGNSLLTNVYAMRTATDDAWSAAAGLGGSNFSDLGAVVSIFIDVNQPELGPFQGAPVAAVTATENGASAPSRDYYFSDADPVSRASLDLARTQTGANGTSVITGPLPTNEYSGAHGSCNFGDVRGAIPGLVQVQEFLGSCN